MGRAVRELAVCFLVSGGALDCLVGLDLLNKYLLVDWAIFGAYSCCCSVPSEAAALSSRFRLHC